MVDGATGTASSGFSNNEKFNFQRKTINFEDFREKSGEIFP